MENKMMTEMELNNVTGGMAHGDNCYVNKAGDTLVGIAARYNTTVEKLMALNPRITNPDVIYAGEMIRIR